MNDSQEQKMRKIGSVFWQLLFPRVCPACGELLKKKLTEGEEPPFICPACYAKLQFVGDNGCMKCSRPVPEEEEYCDDCRKRKLLFDRGRALLLHDEAARKILYDLKYRNCRDNADFIGYEMAVQMGDSLRIWDADALIPVPLHPKRQLQRGYNQAERIAESISYWTKRLYGLSLPVVCNVLFRTAYTRPQKELGAGDRETNLRSVFRAELPDALKRVVLVDDIFTSGSTLSACADALKMEGAERVFFLTGSIVP